MYDWWSNPFGFPARSAPNDPFRDEEEERRKAEQKRAARKAQKKGVKVQIRAEEDMKRQEEERRKEKRIKLEDAAVIIQRLWRGHNIRKQKIVQKLKTLNGIRQKVTQIEEKYLPYVNTVIEKGMDYVDTLPFNEKKKLLRQLIGYEEELTRLILSVDSVSTGNVKIIRRARKDLVNFISKRLERVDPYLLQMKQKVAEEQAKLDAEEEHLKEQQLIHTDSMQTDTLQDTESMDEECSTEMSKEADSGMDVDMNHSRKRVLPRLSELCKRNLRRRLDELQKTVEEKDAYILQLEEKVASLMSQLRVQNKT